MYFSGFVSCHCRLRANKLSKSEQLSSKNIPVYSSNPRRETTRPRPTPPPPESGEASQMRPDEQTAHRTVDLVSSKLVYGSKPGLHLTFRLLRRQVNISVHVFMYRYIFGVQLRCLVIRYAHCTTPRTKKTAARSHHHCRLVTFYKTTLGFSVAFTRVVAAGEGRCCRCRSFCFGLGCGQHCGPYLSAHRAANTSTSMHCYSPCCMQLNNCTTQHSI